MRNMEMYGTNDENKIQLLNLGIPFSLMNCLESNDQIKNISMDSFGNLIANSKLYDFKKTQNGLIKYEMEKFIVFS